MGLHFNTRSVWSLHVELTDFLLVWFSQETLQTQQNRLHIVDRTPLVFEDVQAYPAAEVDVRVVDRGLEEHGRRAVGVVAGEIEAEFEVQIRVRRVFRSDNRGRPVQHVSIGVGKGRDSRCGRHHQCHEFGLEALYK